MVNARYKELQVVSPTQLMVMISHPPTLPHTLTARKVHQCFAGRCCERVCAALIICPHESIKPITIDNIKRLDITAYCSKMKIKSDLTLFLSKFCTKKLHK